MAAFKHTWSVEMESVLISLVKNYPFLWNSKNKNFKRRSHKSYALYKLTLEMKRRFPKYPAMFTNARIKARFNALKLNYLQEMRRQAKAKDLYVPRRRRFAHYEELSFLKKVYEENRKKPEKSISISADISEIQPILLRGGFLPLTVPVLPAPSALPVLPLLLSQSCQVTILNKNNSKLPDQQTIFYQLGGVLLNCENMKLLLKPKFQHEEKYSKPFSNIIIVPTQITRNRNKNHEVKSKQDKESVLSVSAISSDSSSTRLIKPEPNSDEDIANGVKPSSISSKGSVPSKNLNGRIGKKRKSQRRCSRMTIKSNVCTRSRSVVNEILSKPKSEVPPDSCILQIKKEPLSPENSYEKSMYFENKDDDSWLEATNFCEDLNQPVSKEQYPGMKDHISEAERGCAIGRLQIPKTEIVGSCTGLFQSNAFDSKGKSPIPNRNSTSLESGFPAEDASFSLFLDRENHEKKYHTNSGLPVIENVYSAKTPEDLKLDEQLESFGNFVSASLRSLPPKSRNRIMFRICNVLMNPNIQNL